jgi:phospholipid transport system substrate-binding protein
MEAVDRCHKRGVFLRDLNFDNIESSTDWKITMLMAIHKTVAAFAIAVGYGVAAFGIVPDANAQAPAAPASVIEALNGKLLDTMRKAKALGVKGRFDALAPVLTKTYDTAGMTKTAVGAPWETMQPAQRTALVDAFTRMMVATYAKRFDGFSGETFEILLTAEQPPADKLVKTRIIAEGGKAYAINYVMRKSETDWRIADVYLDGTISELASRRAEFTAILKSGGPDGLLAAIRRQADKLLADPAG